MNAAKPSEFKHTTLMFYPESLMDGHWTPKQVGITLLDEEPGFTGIYLRDANGGLWPARTVSHTPPEHYQAVCEAWLARDDVHEDKRQEPHP